MPIKTNLLENVFQGVMNLVVDVQYFKYSEFITKKEFISCWINF